MRRVKVKPLPRSVLYLMQAPSPHTGPGETRSGDFPDGTFTKKFNRVFRKILNKTLVKKFQVNPAIKISHNPLMKKILPLSAFPNPLHSAHVPASAPSKYKTKPNPIPISVKTSRYQIENSWSNGMNLGSVRKRKIHVGIRRKRSSFRAPKQPFFSFSPYFRSSQGRFALQSAIKRELLE